MAIETTTAMTAINLRSEIVQQLKDMQDMSMLQRVLAYVQSLKRDESPDFTDDELAELDAEHDKAVRGEGPSYSWEEVKEMARKALKG